MTSTSYSRQVPAAAKTLRALEAVANSTSGLTTAELLEVIGGSRSGLYALVNTLRSDGYISTVDGRHHVGPALRRLGGAHPSPLPDLIPAFRAETSDRGAIETLALSWPEGTGNVIAVETPGEGQVRVSYPVGTPREPTRADSVVMSAGANPLAGDLERIRTEGMATFEDQELIELATPICADGVHPVAAVVGGIPIGLSTPETIDRLIARLRQLAARLSYRIGASVYQPYGWEAGEGVGPASDLDPAELDKFLEGLWSAQLACVRADGSPHVVPLWYEWDGTNMWLAASPGASWREAISHNKSVSVTLDEPWPPLRRVFLSGQANEVSPRKVPGGLSGLRRRLANRYLGRGAADRPEMSEIEGWAAIRIDPDRLHGRQGLGTGR